MPTPVTTAPLTTVQGRALVAAVDNSPPAPGRLRTGIEDIVGGLGLLGLLTVVILAAGAPIAFVVWLVTRVAERW